MLPTFKGTTFFFTVGFLVFTIVNTHSFAEETSISDNNPTTGSAISVQSNEQPLHRLFGENSPIESAGVSKMGTVGEGIANQSTLMENSSVSESSNNLQGANSSEITEYTNIFSLIFKFIEEMLTKLFSGFSNEGESNNVSMLETDVSQTEGASNSQMEGTSNATSNSQMDETSNATLNSQMDETSNAASNSQTEETSNAASNSQTEVTSTIAVSLEHNIQTTSGLETNTEQGAEQNELLSEEVQNIEEESKEESKEDSDFSDNASKQNKIEEIKIIDEDKLGVDILDDKEYTKNITLEGNAKDFKGVETIRYLAGAELKINIISKDGKPYAHFIDGSGRPDQEIVNDNEGGNTPDDILVTEDQIIVGSPLVLYFNESAYKNKLKDEFVKFDFYSNGSSIEMPFVSDGAGFLAIDKDHDGRITKGNELFGPQTNDGFKELQAYDSNHDGVIDNSDKDFNELVLWSKDDSNNDIIKSISHYGIKSITIKGTSYFEPTKLEIYGNKNGYLGYVLSRNTFTFENGQQRVIEDLMLRLK